MKLQNYYLNHTLDLCFKYINIGRFFLKNISSSLSSPVIISEELAHLSHYNEIDMLRYTTRN